MLKISDLQTKDIVNVSDGKRLGNIEDLDVNLSTGEIKAIIIGNSGKVLGFLGRGEEIAIPWRNIVKIGSDVILVRYYKSSYDNNSIEELK